MQKKKESLLFSPKFKKMYIVITCCLWLLANIIFNVLYLFNNNVVASSDIVYSYSTALFLVFVVLGMIVDESIRKYPGIIVTLCTSVYSFSYVNICVLKAGYGLSGAFILLFFALYIVVSFLIYKYIYPKVVVRKNAVKWFNTLYLIFVVLMSIGIGSFYWISNL